MIVSIWAATSGYVDDLPVSEVRRFEKELHEYLDINAADTLRAIRETKTFSDETKAAMKSQTAAFKETFVASMKQVVGA